MLWHLEEKDTYDSISLLVDWLLGSLFGFETESGDVGFPSVYCEYNG